MSITIRVPRDSATVALLAVMLVTAAPARAGYELQPLARLGEPVGGPAISSRGSFQVGALNDQGQLCFIATDPRTGTRLLQFAGGRFTPIAAAGADGPLGKWPDLLWFHPPVSMNQRGSVVFSGYLAPLGRAYTGATFIWDQEALRVEPLLLPGMPSVSGQQFEWAGGAAPVLNNREEIALVASVRNAAGQKHPAVFFRRPGGELQPVALPDQPLPDGGQIRHAWLPSLNDASVIAFLARRQGEEREFPYLWEAGAVRPLPVPDLPAPPGRLFLGFTGVWVNDRNRNALLAAHFHTPAGHTYALYLHNGQRLIPVAVPAQAMPGGGTLDTVEEGGISAPNAAGQHAFLARLRDGATAAYLMEADGRLTPAVKSGGRTAAGPVTRVGFGTNGSRGIALNGRGQIALTLSVAGSADTLALLMPSDRLDAPP